MEFEKLTAEQYRGLDLDALNARRDAILDALDGDEVETSVLDEQRVLCTAEYERRNKQAEMRSLTMKEVAQGAGKVVERFADDDEEDVPVDEHDTPEYKRAFMEYMRTADRSMLARADATMLTTDAPIAIPTTLSTQVIEKLDDYGDLYNMVTKTSFQGGIEIPIDDFDFTAAWVAETAVTDTQKATRDDKISFSYHEFEARVQWSWLSEIVTFDSFRAKFQPKMSKAIVKLLEEGIINGAGSGQMLGIAKDTRVTNTVEMTEAQFKDWKSWHSIFDAAIEPEYDDGMLMMAKTTWNKYIDTMADDNNAPVNYAYDPVSGKRSQHLVGKDTKLVKASILPDFDSAKAGDVVAIYGDMRNYSINWQPGGNISIMRYPDYDRRRHNLLGYGACDGKVVDPYGFILIKKKGASTGSGS